MAIAGGPLIIGAVAVALLLGAAAAGSGGENGKDEPRPPQGPIPTPQTQDDMRLVDQTICQCFEELASLPSVDTNNPEGLLVLCVAQTLHPDVAWPPQEGDDPSVFKAFEIFQARAAAFMETPDKAAFCEGIEPGQTPTEIIEDWFSTTPTPGKFYAIGSDPELSGADSAAKIARRALDSVLPGAGSQGSQRLDYIHCMSSGPRWNMPLYTSSSFSKKYPAMYGVNGKGLRTAFFPWHENVMAALFEARYPKRGQTAAGKRISGVGAKFATLWLPPVSREALEQGVVTCAQTNWSDGSTSLDPPPEVLSLLKGAP